MKSFRERCEDRICLASQVPYWICTNRARPSWFRRPLWRLRARRWGWR